MPSSTLINVDLPAPFGPINVTISFACKAKLTFLRDVCSSLSNGKYFQTQSMEGLLASAALMTFSRNFNNAVLRDKLIRCRQLI